MATSSCPTCKSESPDIYYGSCFDNIHNTVFLPRLPLDPWHEQEFDRQREVKQRTHNMWYFGWLVENGKLDGYQG